MNEHMTVEQILEQKQWVEAHTAKSVVTPIPPMDTCDRRPADLNKEYRASAATGDTMEERVARLGIKLRPAKCPLKNMRGDLS